MGYNEERLTTDILKNSIRVILLIDPVSNKLEV
jgi:hypothetical protein